VPASASVAPPPEFYRVCDAAVFKSFTDAKQRYGAPRLADELPEYNIKTIAASLRRQGLRAKATRKFSPVSYHEHGLSVSENLLKQDFYASGLNQKWAGDITYRVPGVQDKHGCSNEPRVCLEY
jgi:putative transposase